MFANIAVTELMRCIEIIANVGKYICMYVIDFPHFGGTVVKFIYSEKATKFSEISTLLLTTVHTYSQKYRGDFAKFLAFSEYVNFILFKARHLFFCF